LRLCRPNGGDNIKLNLIELFGKSIFSAETPSNASSQESPRNLILVKIQKVYVSNLSIFQTQDAGLRDWLDETSGRYFFVCLFFSEPYIALLSSIIKEDSIFDAFLVQKSFKPCLFAILECMPFLSKYVYVSVIRVILIYVLTQYSVLQCFPLQLYLCIFIRDKHFTDKNIYRKQI